MVKKILYIRCSLKYHNVHTMNIVIHYNNMCKLVLKLFLVVFIIRSAHRSALIKFYCVHISYIFLDSL